MTKPIMARATAVWLVDNTTLSFKQIADFTGMHELEVQGIADGDVAAGVKGFDPIANNQLTQEEIDKGQANPLYKLKLKFNPAAVGEETRRGPRYTPLSKRQDRPAAIYWLVKFHPELTDGQIGKLVSTEQSLGMDDAPRLPTAIEGLESFTLREDDEDEKPEPKYDADSFFNLPDNDDDEDDEDQGSRR